LTRIERKRKKGRLFKKLILGELSENSIVMKKIITSASIVALGAASLSAAYAPGLSEPERTKFWSVSASLRGFYDDNFRTTSPKDGSAGVEFSPSVRLNFPMDQTLITVSYIYGMRWYEDRGNDDNFDDGGSTDNTHQFDAHLKHAFTEDYKINVDEAFVIGQEPGLMNPKGFLVQKYRAPGNNIYNGAGFDFNGKFSPRAGFMVGYNNQFYDYDQDVYSQSLDRMEHAAVANFRYQVMEETWALLGYQFGVMDMDYFDNDPRNNYSHYMFLGADHTFNPKLNASVRFGAQYSTFPDAEDYDSSLSSDHWAPYADVNLTYTYAKGSAFQAGLKNSSIVSDLSSLSQDALTVYLGVSHEITAKLKANVIGQYQNSAYNEGEADGVTEDYYLFGANLRYEINQYLAAEVGYNFDNLHSSAHRDYDRNRYYLGVTASY
jgi:hypothetical protein